MRFRYLLWQSAIVAHLSNILPHILPIETSSLTSFFTLTLKVTFSLEFLELEWIFLFFWHVRFRDQFAVLHIRSRLGGERSAFLLGLTVMSMISF